MLLSYLAGLGYISTSTIEFLKRRNLRTTEGINQHYRIYNTFRNIPGCTKLFEDELISMLKNLEFIKKESDITRRNGYNYFLIRDVSLTSY
jgi:hypothetical protein